MPPKKSVAVFSNYFWTVYNFRKPLIQELLAQGYKVTAIGAEDEYAEKTKALGCDVVFIKTLDPKSTGLLKELRLICEIIRKLRKLDCGYIFTFTIKPNIFATLTSFLTGKKTIVTVNGLGSVFSGVGPTKFLTFLFKLSFAKASKIIFQNKDDYHFFEKKIGLGNEKVIFVRGSGVNPDVFTFSKRPQQKNTELVFLLACRLLKEKGIFEYLEAAGRIKKKYPSVKFNLLVVPALNPSAIPLQDLDTYKEQGIIDTLSKTDNMNALLETVDVLVLPSYYNEGVPKILLEGLAKGLPIITTDRVGCRETVADNVNGYLIEARSVDALEQAFEKMIQLPAEERLEMRMQSRKLAETDFNEKKVIESYLAAIP